MPDASLPPPPAAPLALIGVSCCRRTLQIFPGHWVGERYLLAVAEAAGGLPVTVPALGEPTYGAAGLDALLDRLDGLLLTGSPSNVEPRHYTDQDSRTPDLHDAHRDATTLPLIRRAVARAVPILAICRGIQELNVALGGSLHQQLHDVPGRLDHRSDKSKPWEERYGAVHPVTILPGTTLAELTGTTGATMVNSLHAQGIDRLAPGLRAEAVAPDGTIEAVCLPDAPALTLGVQWHAEWNATRDPVGRALFGAFGDAARLRAARRALMQA